MRGKKLNPKKKCALYERILKYLTGATEIRIRSLSGKGDHGFVELVDVDPDDFKPAGFDDGLNVNYNAEVYVEDYGGVMKPRDDARIIVEVWFSTDPWAEIESLKAEVKRLKSV